MTIVQTSKGRVRGEEIAAGIRFLGIPYAAPPVGENRFRAPAPVQPWEGERDATGFGPTAPKLPYAPPIDTILGDTTIPGDEWLNLNVWTPGTDAGTYPVLVWIHGGALRNGSSSQPIYDGSAFARDGVVFVSINYRLGMEGFGVFDGAPPNRGLLDAIAALEWVRDEIAAFGGDPARVTVGGQSAGANITAALLAAPRARGLFHGAVLQSGPPLLQDEKAARTTAANIAKEVGVAPSAEALAAVDPTTLVEAQFAYTRRGNPLSSTAAFGMIADPDSVPIEPVEAVQRGEAASVPVLLGATTEEHKLWFVPTRMNDKIGRFVFWAAGKKAKIPKKVVRAYREALAGQPLGDVLGSIALDKAIRMPSLTIADAHRAPVHVYDFDWKTPVMGLGACHALELGFVFDNLSCGESVTIAGAEAPQHLADQMHGAWVSFAASGDPGWPAWDSSRPTRVFDGAASPVVPDPRAVLRAAWA
ncbi:carboxylesterase/lipase family protein [Microbacterium sp. NIBRBAC000506063]|uniref:carboxylesterase/lipase family protein n=1 Tax=Microbacterium sp. NIBRBAC000506063 TaxID=2734618 RepID=UPI001CB7522B|nr:carboxylesterase family protein [Microbacterium sp. NIBRBAC000506063]